MIISEIILSVKTNEIYILYRDSGLAVKNPSTHSEDLRDTGLRPVSGRFPGGGHGNPLQYSCLESPMDRGAWQATVHEVTESDRTEAI